MGDELGEAQSPGGRIRGIPEEAERGKGHMRGKSCRCNRLRCPLARMSGLQCFNMGHNGHGINLYGVSMILM